MENTITELTINMCISIAKNHNQTYLAVLRFLAVAVMLTVKKNTTLFILIAIGCAPKQEMISESDKILFMLI